MQIDNQSVNEAIKVLKGFCEERGGNCFKCPLQKNCGASVKYMDEISKEKKDEYRPFEDIDEFLNAYFFIENGEECFLDISLLQHETLWLRKIKTEFTVLVTGFCRNGLVLNGELLDFEEIYTDYEFLNGEPCGVKNDC